MRVRKQKREDNIRPLKGWAKFLHRLGRLLLFPLRRPIITLLILLVLFLAPTFRGVKPVAVPQWYATQISDLYHKVLIWWGVRQPEVTPGEFKFHPEEAAPAPVVPSDFPMPEPQDENAPNILDVLRGSEEGEGEVVVEPQSTEEQQPIQKVKEETPKETVTEQPSAPIKTEQEPKLDIKPMPELEPLIDIDTSGISPVKTIVLPEDESLYTYPKDRKVYGLKYLDYPHEITGKVKVHTCNEIEVNNEYVLIYGVYVHPLTAQGEQATQYLKDSLDNKTVTCGIVAYTDENVATGICYYNGININMNMIQKGYTKNIAL